MPADTDSHAMSTIPDNDIAIEEFRSILMAGFGIAIRRINNRINDRIASLGRRGAML